MTMKLRLIAAGFAVALAASVAAQTAAPALTAPDESTIPPGPKGGN